jgi:hypothetical protein
MTARRCIAFVGALRCPYRVATSLGDLQCCRRHGRIQLLLIDDMLGAQTRLRLAHARWETRSQGQELVDKLFRRRAA